MGKTIFLVFLLLLSMSCGLMEKPAEDRNSSRDYSQLKTEIEIVIENDLEDFDIVEIWIDPSEEPWSENLLAGRLNPGEEFTVTVNEATDYDIQLVDEDGECYTIMYQSVDEDGFQWLVTAADCDRNASNSGETAVITIENGLNNENLWYFYGTLSSSDDWEAERLDYMVLEPRESFSFEVLSGDYYDFYARNGNSDFYFSFDNYIDDDGFNWIVSHSDLDNTLYTDDTQGPTAPVTLINRLGNVSIMHAWEDEKGGKNWGEDILEGSALEPREEFAFYLTADKFYDLQVADEDGNTYSLWGVAVKDNGIFWEIVPDDIDE